LTEWSESAAGPERLLDEARCIHEEDRRMCHAIGRAGADLIRDGLWRPDALQHRRAWRRRNTAPPCP